MQVSNATRAVESPPLVPYILEFWFEGNGAADPIKFAGSIASVTRLTSTAGVAFYRVKFGRVLGDKRQIWTYRGGVIADIEGGDVDAEVRLPVGLEMPSTPAATRDEIDVVVRLAAANINNLAVGARVCVEITFDQAIKV